MSYAAEVLADSPLAYYRLGESSGTTMLDSSGNSRNGAYTGPVTRGVAGLLSGDADTAASWPGGFTAANGTVSHASWMAPSAYTVEAVIQPVALGAGSRTIVARKGGLGPWSLRIDGTTLAFWTLNAAGNTWQIVESSVPMVVGTMYHVAATVTAAGVQTIYVNGTATGSGSFAGFYASSEPLYVGAANTGEIFSGVIDEVAFYGTDLTQERIAVHANLARFYPYSGFGSNPDHRSPLVSMENLASVAAGLQRIALVTALGDDTEAGTEVAVAGYGRATPTSVHSDGTARTPTLSGYFHMDATFDAMSAVEVVGWEGWSSDGATRYTYGLFSPTLCVARTATNTLCVSAYRGVLPEDVGNPRWFDGTKIVFHPNHCPAGLTPGVHYYVRDSDGQRFRVATTPGGEPVTLTGDGDEAWPSVAGAVLSVPADNVVFGSLAICGTELNWPPFGHFNEAGV